MRSWVEWGSDKLTNTTKSVLSLFNELTPTPIARQEVNSKQVKLLKLEKEYADLLDVVIETHEEIRVKLGSYNKMVEEETIIIKSANESRRQWLVEMNGKNIQIANQTMFNQIKKQIPIDLYAELDELLYSVPTRPDDYVTLSLEAKHSVLTQTISDLTNHNSLLREAYNDFFGKKHEEDEIYKNSNKLSNHK